MACLPKLVRLLLSQDLYYCPNTYENGYWPGGGGGTHIYVQYRYVPR